MYLACARAWVQFQALQKKINYLNFIAPIQLASLLSLFGVSGGDLRQGLRSRLTSNL
jgi:hypothetical protein